MQKRVIAPTILVSVFWLAVSGAVTFFVFWVYQSQKKVLKEDVETIQATVGMRENLIGLQTVSSDAPDKEARQSLAEAAKFETDFEKYLQIGEATSFTPSEKKLSHKIRENFPVYRQWVRSYLESGGAGKPPVPSDAQRREGRRLLRNVSEPIEALRQVNEQYFVDVTERTAKASRWMTWILAVVMTIGPILGVAYGLWVARGLQRSISQINITLRGATGELDREVGEVRWHASDGLPAVQQRVEHVAARIRQVMDELQQARQQALLSARLAAVGELAAGVAHEIRNPLCAVKLLVQTVAQKQAAVGPIANRPGGDRLEIAPTTDKQFQVILQEIARMESTIQGLLEFARPPQLRRVNHDVRETVRRALNLVAGRAKQQQVEIATDFSEAAVAVDGDPEQLHQVFINLALNAIEAMPQGGVLQVALRAKASASKCQIVFSDSGTGISQPVLEKIFEPFVTNKQRGTGLGLAISRRLVEEHGGTLQAANCPEGGAVFTIELPATNCDRTNA